MGEQGWRCPATWRRHCRGRRLGNRVAGLAGIFRPDMTDNLEVSRHVIQHFGHILAEFAHTGTAVGADAGAVILGLMHHVLTR
jgi:hypothetical protein